jgi:hypothetical protein
MSVGHNCKHVFDQGSNKDRLLNYSHQACHNQSQSLYTTSTGSVPAAACVDQLKQLLK